MNTIAQKMFNNHGVYTQWDQSEKAIELFEMMEVENVKFNECGLVSIAVELFEQDASEEWDKTRCHLWSSWVLVVMLECRVGHITKVEELIQNLPITAYRSVPAAFLELAEFIVTLRFAEKAAQQLPKLDHNDPGTYVLLSKIYSSMEKWEESKWIRELMGEIYKMLDDEISKWKEAGYIPEKSEVLFEMDEEEKETTLSLHNEKIAY
ncbi:pentatricopeptide repeat-containing protein [Cucumis melo var. makuwa]|uniref:Pentatricopeptide repeat-containing protein n=1 Tax=Cucumis melo var. makuwa TaxID=1194695 RepID=A0A5D3CFL7_CUCMM|nr:pentatricopeptide repeat-containing protein [Cucumis melo var. makuwa]